VKKMATIVIDTDTTWAEDKDYSGDDIIVTNGATLTINSWSKSGDVGNTLEDARKGLITIQCRSLTIDEGAKISADGTGYPAYNSMNKSGRGPGRGVCVSGRGSGAGYGGEGGPGVHNYSTVAEGGQPYGNPFTPIYMGSSGASSSWGYGGNGAGAIRIIATSNIMCNGIISANGSNAGESAGGGSGGSVWITCASLSGSGSIEAKGGNGGGTGTTSGYRGGAGGGGRILIEETDEKIAFFCAVAGGTVKGSYPAEDGTCYVLLLTLLFNHYFIETCSGPINFKFLRCMNWADNGSHGGNVCWDAEVSDIFGDIASDKREQGGIDYRKIFFANCSTIPISGIKGYISQFTPAPNDEIYICASGTNIDTITEASGYTFVQPSSLSDPNAIDWGTLQPGEYKPLWIKRVVQPGGDGYHNNSFEIKIGKVS